VSGSRHLDSIPKTMRAVVYRGVGDLRIEEIETPRIHARELLVRVAACGVCPTDIKKIRHGTVAPPRVFGHETAGVVAKVGARVRRFRVGDRVALHHHVPCLECHACRHRAFAQCATYKRTGITAGFEPAGGGYAEYVRVMSFVLPGVVRIPAGNSFLEGAMLEPVNTVLKAVERLNLLPRDCVLVAGQGPIGLMFTRLLRRLRVRVLATDLMEERLEKARRFGAQLAVRADDPSLEETIERMTRGRGLDAAILAVPSNGIVKQAQSWLRGGGQTMLFAHTKRGDRADLDLAGICVDEQDLIGSYSSDITLQRTVARIVFGRQLDVRALISHQFPLARTAEAVELAANPRPDALKVVVSQFPFDIGKGGWQGARSIA
jgi:L-iditol 2-dehydrogenase